MIGPIDSLVMRLTSSGHVLLRCDMCERRKAFDADVNVVDVPGLSVERCKDGKSMTLVWYCDKCDEARKTMLAIAGDL